MKSWGRVIVSISDEEELLAACNAVLVSAGDQVADGGIGIDAVGWRFLLSAASLALAPTTVNTENGGFDRGSNVYGGLCQRLEDLTGDRRFCFISQRVAHEDQT